MGRWFWFGFTGLLIVGMLTGGYVMFTPKIGHASAARIEAVLHASLKVQDLPDPGSEVRYRRLVEILRRIDKEPLSSLPRPKTGKSTAPNEAVLIQVENLLREGGLRVPKRDPNGLYKELPALKDVAKLIGLAMNAAQERGDQTACARWAELGLHFSAALENSAGTVIDKLVHIAVDAVVLRAIYLAEINGGFDSNGRVKLLSLLKPGDGRSQEMAAAVRRDFQVFWTPLLLDPEKHAKDLAPYSEADFAMATGDDPDEPRKEPELAGTFDPIETARLSGQVYDAIIRDLDKPYVLASHAAERLIEKATEDLPNPAFTGPEGMWYRVRMNLGKNTLGRQGISSVSLLQLGSAAARNALTRNLVRAVILLRTGQRPIVPDPYGKGSLRFDTKRKIVWSVGEKGADDGGAIGKGWDYSALDFGCPYGDRSWTPASMRLAPGGPPVGAPGGPPSSYSPD